MNRRVNCLVYTSCDDVRSSLALGGQTRDDLTMARDLCASLGYLTKLRLLEAALRRLGREEEATHAR